MRVIKPHFYWIALLIIVLSGSVIAQDATPVPTEVPAPQVLRIWLPDVLVSPDNDELRNLLETQATDFASTRENVSVEIRLRKVGTSGGIMSTLRTGSLVARDALPTLTLLRRQDLVDAQLAGLIQTMEGRIPSAIQSDIDNALALGQVDGDLNGIPYLLELRHVVYRPIEGVNYSGWSYDDVLDRNQRFVFAAGRDVGLSEVVALQYLEAGGAVNGDDHLEYNEAALRTTFDFYEEATASEIIDGFVMNFFTANDYMTNFTLGEYNAGVFTSTQYLQLVQEDDSLQIAPIPTATGATTGTLNGWMWVLVSKDAEQAQLATDYILWSLDTVRQSEVAEVLQMLPSRRSALSNLLNREEESLYIDLLDNARLPLTDAEGGVLASTIQEALSSVMTAVFDAETATRYVSEQQSE